MKILVTGSSGHLGEALVRTLQKTHHQVISLDQLLSLFTTHVGSITDRDLVRQCMTGVNAVLHTATLHKPHVATHSRQDFIDTNISGTLTLLEEAVTAGVESFVFTSTTSVFGAAMTPPIGEPAAWITEEVRPIPKNIYGVTKSAAEDLCELFHRRDNLACVVLRTSRFFPEADDNRATRNGYDDANAKTNEYLYRRVELADVVNAHVLAMQKAVEIGFGRYIISATTPFQQEDLSDLRVNAPAVLSRRVSGYEQEYSRRNWKMFPQIERVYVNERARTDLGWRPKYDFQSMLNLLKDGGDLRSPLSCAVGSKGYHAQQFVDGPYPVS